MQAQWQAEVEALRKAIRVEVMPEILDDSAYRVVRIRLSMPCLHGLPLLSHTEDSLQGWHAGTELADCEQNHMWSILLLELAMAWLSVPAGIVRC